MIDLALYSMISACRGLPYPEKIGPDSHRFATGEPRCTIALMSPIGVGAAWVFRVLHVSAGRSATGAHASAARSQGMDDSGRCTSNVVALTQSADGVLWIGTQSGLYRFRWSTAEFRAPADDSSTMMSRLLT